MLVDIIFRSSSGIHLEGQILERPRDCATAGYTPSATTASTSEP